MQGQQIRFEDGAAYERKMGTWSGLVGDIFLDWLMPPPGWRWIDVGCGNGAFSQRLVDRCAPAEMQGIDPPRHSLPLREPGRRLGWRSSRRATRWRCRLPIAGSTRR